MSFTKEKTEQIRNYLLEKIATNDSEYIQKTCKNFSVSANTVYRYIRNLVLEGIIVIKEQRKKGECNYKLTEVWHPIFSYDTKNILSEEQVYINDIFPLLKSLGKKTIRIWDYAFTEMMNNALEHSQADVITCLVIQTYVSTKIFIIDNGIGIFEKIKQYHKNELNEDITLNQAVAELFAGKFTTDKSNHSGEGIFFTSRAVDHFAILSGTNYFSHTGYDDDYYYDELEKMMGEGYIHNEGTVVYMEVLNNTSKDLGDIMHKYSNQERGFYKTSIAMVELFPSGNPVSRSEAKRLGTLLERFEEAQLDFKNIETIGQGFTHELFIVFQKSHPDFVIRYENANNYVENMIQRVLITDKKNRGMDELTVESDGVNTDVIVNHSSKFNEYEDDMYI